MLPRIARERAALTFAPALRLLLLVVAFIPYALGWLAGWLVSGALWLVAAVLAGYHDGRR